MGRSRVIFLFWVLLYSSAGINKSSCSEIISLNSYSELDCYYDLVTAGQICDCRHRMKVKCHLESKQDRLKFCANVFVLLFVKEFVLPAFSGNINRIVVKNCPNLLVRKGTFQDIGYVDRIRFENIRNLMLEGYALEFANRLPAPKIKLTFSNVRFKLI